MRGVLQPHHSPAAVMVANHADEADDGPGRLVAYQFFMLCQRDRLLGHRRAQDDRHRWWSLPAIWSRAWSSTSASTPSPSRTPPGEPGRLTTRVRPATPHTPRDSTEVGTLGSPEWRIAS